MDSAKTMSLFSLILGVTMLGAAATTKLPSDAKGLVEYMGRDDFAGRAACEELVNLGKAAVPELLGALQNREPWVRYWSASALCRIGEERAYKPLVELLRNDPNPVVRSTVLWHLQHFKKEEVFELAVQSLGDGDGMVRSWALKVLEEGKQSARLPEVLKLLKDKEPGVRHDALMTAVKLGGNSQFALVKKLAADDPDAEVRAGALRCLTLLTEKKAEIVAVMIRALSDASPDVQGTAARLLGKGTNQSFGFDPSLPAAEREKAIAQWQEWYEARKNRLRWNEEKHRFVVLGEK